MHQFLKYVEKHDLALETKVTLILALILINFFFKCITFLILVENKVQLYTTATIMLALIASIYAFTEIFVQL